MGEILHAYGRIYGIVYPGNGRAEGFGGRAQLVASRDGGKSYSGWGRKQKWRPTLWWAGLTARAWARRENARILRNGRRREAADRQTQRGFAVSRSAQITGSES